MLKTTVTVLILQPQRIEKRHKLFIKKYKVLLYKHKAKLRTF